VFIQRICLEDVSVSPASGAHVATVRFETGAKSLCLRASALATPPDGADTASDALIARALAEDALRQLRRLPEYRGGASDVTVADQAWPTFATEPSPALS